MTSPAPAPAYVWVKPVVPWAAHLAAVKAYRDTYGESYDGILVAEAGHGSLDDLSHFSHPTVIIAPRDSKVGSDMIAGLMKNAAGHSRLAAVHNPGDPPAILTIMDNEVTVTKSAQIPFLFGAAQKGVALAIDYCVMVGILPKDKATRDKLVIGVEVYLDKAATDHERVLYNVVMAVVQAIVNAVTGMTTLDKAAAACATKHVFSDVDPVPAPDLKELGLTA